MEGLRWWWVERGGGFEVVVGGEGWRDGGGGGDGEWEMGEWRDGVMKGVVEGKGCQSFVQQCEE